MKEDLIATRREVGDIRIAIWNTLTCAWLGMEGFPSRNDVPARSSRVCKTNDKRAVHALGKMRGASEAR